MSKDSFSRREFIGYGAAAAGASLVGAGPLPGAEPSAPPEAPAVIVERRRETAARVRFGIVGVGMQGVGLLTEAIRVPDVECVAACDLYDGRHVLAREVVGRADLPVTRRYQDLLANKDVDAIIGAVPDHWHRQLVVDAVAAGKDVYIEKPMSHTPADGVAMVDAVKKAGRILQVGSQRVSAPLYAKAREIVASGKLGELTLVEGWNGRNDPSGAWKYPPPPDLSPANLDWDTWLGKAPKRPFDPQVFASWRAYKEYGTGVAGDLLVHLITGMMFVLDLNQAPTRVSSVGGIRRWKDGRNMPDVHAAIYDYAGLPVYMRLNLGTQMPETYRIQGSKGVLEISGNAITFTPQPGRDMAPSYYAGSFPRAMREAYQKQWNEENAARVAQDAVTETVTIRGAGGNDTRLHLANFFDAVRTRKPVVEDETFGHHAALACHMANESYFRGDTVTWDAGKGAIRA